MSAILDPPSTALLAGVDASKGAAIEEPLLREETSELRAVTTIDDAVTAATGDRSVACVVTTTELPDGSGPDLCRAVRRVEEDLPVVLLGDGDDAALLRESLDAGVTDFVPQSAEGSRLRSVVDDPVHVGLVVCSAVAGEPCEAVFEDVVVRSLDDRSRDD